MGGEKKHETESEGENCRLYIYSGKNCSERIDDLEVEERGREEEERKKKQKRRRRRTYGLRSNLPSRWDGEPGGAVREEQSRPVNEETVLYRP